MSVWNEKKSQGYVGFGTRFVIIQRPLLDFVNTPLDIRKKREGRCLKISGSDPRPFHHITNTFLKECKPQFKEVIKICLNILFYSDTELWTQVILQFHRELQIRSNNWNIALWCICEMAGMCSDTTKTKSIAFCSQALAP